MEAASIFSLRAKRAAKKSAFLYLASVVKGQVDSLGSQLSRRAFSKAGDSASRQRGMVGRPGGLTESPIKERRIGRWSEKETRGPERCPREKLVVLGNIDRGRKEGVVADGNGDEKPVQPRGAGEGRKRVSGDVVVGVGVVVDFANIKATFKFFPSLGKFGRRETGVGACRIRQVCNEVKIPTNTSGDPRIDGRKRV